MSLANLPQQRGASDIAAALRLTTAGLISAGGLTVDEVHQLDQLDAMTAAVEPLPPLLPKIGEPIDPCTCPPSAICASSCGHCDGLPDDVPCPHDVMPPAPVTVDVGEPVPAGACRHCPHGLVEHNPTDGWCGRCSCSGQPVSEVDQDPPAALELSVAHNRPAHVDVVHQVAAQQLAAAGVDVVVDWPAVHGQALQAVASTAARPGTGHLPTLDWRSRHDVRSLSYGVREHLQQLTSAPLQLADVLLPIGPVLDQGSEGECVGMGVIDAANVLFEAAGHIGAHLLGAEDAHQLYKRAQQLDDRPGESYSGTSVLAGMAAGVEAGLWQRYLWSFGTRDIAATLMSRTPVIVGIPWLSGMYETAAGGRVEVAGDDTGAGHCLVIVGLKLTGPQGQPGPWFTWLNSWGTSYGDGGLGYVHHADLARLLRSQGEAAVPVRGGVAATS